jgi:hypothetical protein
MGLADTLGMDTFKGYRNEGEKDKTYKAPVEWEGKTKLLANVAARLLVQNEHWAAKCRERQWLKCVSTWGQDMPPYLPYTSISGSPKLPVIYDGAVTFDDFVNTNEEQGTLLVMNWQLQSGSGGRPRFYVVAIKFSDFTYKNKTATFSPTKGKFVTGKISVTVKSNSYTITAANKTFKKIPLGAVWIKCKGCEDSVGRARDALHGDIRGERRNPRRAMLPSKGGNRPDSRSSNRRRPVSRSSSRRPVSRGGDSSSEDEDDDRPVSRSSRRRPVSRSSSRRPVSRGGDSSSEDEDDEFTATMKRVRKGRRKGRGLIQRGSLVQAHRKREAARKRRRDRTPSKIYESIFTVMEDESFQLKF